MTRQLPPETGTGCMLCIDAARIPLLGGLLGQLESPAAWSETDYAAGYQWVALLQEELIMGCSLGQQLSDIGVILAHASGLTDALTTERLEQLLPAIGGRLEEIENTGIDPANELASGTRRWASAQDIADLRGNIPDGWLGFGQRAPDLADIYTALSVDRPTAGLDEAVSVWDTVIDAIDAGGDISNIVDMIRGVGDTITDGTIGSVQALGQYLTALALGVISWQMNLDALQRAGIENNTRETREKLDEILLALRGAAQPPQTIQEAIEGIDTVGNQEAVLNEILLALRGPLPQADNLLAILRGGSAVAPERNVIAALVGNYPITDTYNIAVLIREQLNPYSLNASFNLYGIATVLYDLKQKLLNEPTAAEPDLIETNLYDLLLALQSGADDSTAQQMASIANSNLAIDIKLAALVKCACDGYTEPGEPNIVDCDTYSTWDSTNYLGAQGATGRCPLRLDQPDGGVQHWTSVSADGLTATQDIYGWTVQYTGTPGWFAILDIPAWDSQYMQLGEEDPIYPEPGTGLINRHTTNVNIYHQACEGTVTICPPTGGTNPPAPVCITGRTLIPEGESVMVVHWDQPHPPEFQLFDDGTGLDFVVRGEKFPAGTTIEIIGQHPADVLLESVVTDIGPDDYTLVTSGDTATFTLTDEQSRIRIQRAPEPYGTVPFWAKVCMPGVANPFE